MQPAMATSFSFPPILSHLAFCQELDPSVLSSIVRWAFRVLSNRPSKALCRQGARLQADRWLETIHPTLGRCNPTQQAGRALHQGRLVVPARTQRLYSPPARSDATLLDGFRCSCPVFESI